MTILRDITNAKHREVEALPLIQCLMQGHATVPIYVAYLYELKEIYKHIETLAKKHGILQGLEGIERYELISKDLLELDSTHSHNLMPSTEKYIAHLHELANDENRKHLLMAHVYVRHMGDLYGGKLMARVIPGNGFAYQFDDRPRLIKAFNDKLSIDLGDEANLAFNYFINIFSELWENYGI